MNQKRILIFSGSVILIATLISVGYSLFIGSPITEAEMPRFVVLLGSTKTDIASKLAAENFIHAQWPMTLSISLRGSVEPGSYKISRTMSPWQIAGVLAKKPYMRWVVIPEGLRKEEIADTLAKELGWNATEKNDWITVFTALRFDYVEGVYFPDTYLIPIDESPLKVAERLQAKFQEKFAPYGQEAAKQNIKWDTVLKIASIVQREAAGKDDMPLIAGILWTRLLKNMKLDIDATLQYIKGTSDNWWPQIIPADKQLDSPYNTYRQTGLLRIRSQIRDYQQLKRFCIRQQPIASIICMMRTRKFIALKLMKSIRRISNSICK